MQLICFQVLEHHLGRYVFQLPPLGGRVTLGGVFAAVHAAQQELGFEAYSITQPTLEQVLRAQRWLRPGLDLGALLLLV